MTEVNYRKEVPLLDKASDTKYSPVSGLLDWALISFPPGCVSLVEVILNHKTVQILPYPPGGIALDNTTQRFTINRQVKKGDPLEMVLLNHDDTNAHTISAVLNIMETRVVEPVPMGK